MEPVKIEFLTYKRYRRSLKRPLVTAAGKIYSRTGWLMAIGVENGIEGFGESPDPVPGLQTPPRDDEDSDEIVLNLLKDYLIGRELPENMAEIEKIIDSHIGYISRSVRFGLETALADAAARLENKPLSTWLSSSAKKSVPVNYLLSRPVESWTETIGHIHDRGYRAIKVKVGSDSIENDYRLVKSLREKLGPDMAIRLDANRAWIYQTARNIMQRLQDLNIDYIEEPLRKYDPALYMRLKQDTGLDIALDESLSEIDDIESVIDHGLCDVIILKPALVGGLEKILELYEKARQKGMRAVLTSNLETEIGWSALCHLAASLPEPLPPCGLDTLRLFDDVDGAPGKVKSGEITVPPGKGLGLGDEIWNSL